MLFSYDKIKKEIATISSMEIIEESMYRLISPICLAWLILERKVEDCAIPCGPISSCHPRSNVRDEIKREETKERTVSAEWAMSTKNHWEVAVEWAFLFIRLEVKKTNETKRIAIPMRVTTRGMLLVIGGTIKEGGVKINFEKNHPLAIVPIASRKRALLKFLSSSPMGESEAMEGLREKQKNMIRNL